MTAWAGPRSVPIRSTDAPLATGLWANMPSAVLVPKVFLGGVWLAGSLCRCGMRPYPHVCSLSYLQAALRRPARCDRQGFLHGEGNSGMVQGSSSELWGEVRHKRHQGSQYIIFKLLWSGYMSSCFFLNECDRAHFAHFSFCPLIEYALCFRFPYLRVEINWQHFIVSVLIYTICLTIRVKKICPKAWVNLFSFTAFRPPCPPWTLIFSVLLSLWHRCHFERLPIKM